MQATARGDSDDGEQDSRKRDNRVLTLADSV